MKSCVTVIIIIIYYNSVQSLQLSNESFPQIESVPNPLLIFSRHYHSMEVFATFDVIDGKGNKIAEGHKASFCLEDNQCDEGIRATYFCANYGDQGESFNKLNFFLSTSL